MLLFVVCTAGEFVWNKGGVMQLPVPVVNNSQYSPFN
jgi:hypothetical protein